MKANFVELRRKSREILQALERNERVALYYRGKPKAVMHPVSEPEDEPHPSVADDPAAGMWAAREDMADPTEWVRKLRRGRFDAGRLGRGGLGHAQQQPGDSGRRCR